MNKTIGEQILILEAYKNDKNIKFIDKRFVAKNEWQCIDKEHQFDFRNYDYIIEEQNKTITIQKWLCTNEFGDYFAVELGKNNVGECEKVKLIESYEVKL